MTPTREQVIAWAREAGVLLSVYRDSVEHIERFASLAYAAGLERAAELVATQGKYFVDKPKAIHIVSYETRQLQADAIRTLKGEKE